MPITLPHIWIDADACPQAVTQIIIRAAISRKLATTFVANKPLVLPASQHLHFIQVDKSSDAADTYIKEQAKENDLVVTQDIPLAHALVHAGVSVIDVRGTLFTHDNVAERFSLRNFMQELRDGGEAISGPKPFNDKDKHNFAASFDRELTRLLKAGS
jgi:uncharacterized protein YaiI (UPF0178 family)